ncbi:MAG: TonB family protein [Cyclobacteriaceae bacterium]|jgi:TonB family protein
MNDLNRDIEKYLKDELTPAERHALEKKALHDPFLADALEGHEQLNPAEREQDLMRLENKIRSASTRGRSGWYFPLRIAAGLALVVGMAWWLMNQGSEPTPELTQQDESAEESPEIKEFDEAAPPTMAERIEPRPSTESRQTPAAKVTPATESPDLAVSTQTEKETETRAGDGAGAAPQALKTETAVADEDLARRDAADEKTMKKGKVEELRIAGQPMIQMQLVSGQVRSADDGSPIPGVNIVVKGTTQGTITDANGNYQLEVPANQNQLVYSFIGYSSKEEAIKDPLKNDVTLDADVSQLSEVVVTGYGFDELGMAKAPEYVTTLPEPEGGRKAYQKYLESNLQYPQQALDQKIEGRVTIQFTVTFDGQLNDFNVIRSLGYGCDEEVIRLIRLGPAWSPSKRNEVARDSKVRVRMRFKLPTKKG